MGNAEVIRLGGKSTPPPRRSYILVWVSSQGGAARASKRVLPGQQGECPVHGQWGKAEAFGIPKHDREEELSFNRMPRSRVDSRIPG